MRSRTILIPSAAILSAFVLWPATLGRAQTPANQQVTQATAAVAWDPNAKAQPPVPPPAAQWFAPDWKDPGQVLPDVSFDDAPLNEVAKKLRDWFQDSIDVIVPSSWTSPTVGRGGQIIAYDIDSADPASVQKTMTKLFAGTQSRAQQTATTALGARATANYNSQSSTTSTTCVPTDNVYLNLHVKNVHAEELFNAMNLAFEAANSPVRWQLQMNGDRPSAVLRVLPALLPQLAEAINEPAPTAPPPEKKRMVFFVGDLVGTGMNMEKLYHTVCDVYDKGYSNDGGATAQNDIKFHEEAQLLIVNATPDRVDFLKNTLVALRDEARLVASRAQARRDAAASDSKAKTESPKKPDVTAESKP